MQIQNAGKIKNLLVVLDTGATSSLIHENLLDSLECDAVKIKSSKNIKAPGAGGVDIKFLQITADLHLKSKNLTLNVKNCGITTTGPEDQMLLGVPDLIANNFIMECNNGKVNELSLNQVPLVKINEKLLKTKVTKNRIIAMRNISKNETEISSDINDASNGTQRESESSPESDQQIDLKINGKIHKKSLKKSLSLEAIFSEQNDKKLVKMPDSQYTFWCEIERLKQEMLETNTKSEVKIDPNNEILSLNNPEDKGLKIEIINLLEKVKILFRGDCPGVKNEKIPNYR